MTKDWNDPWENFNSMHSIHARSADYNSSLPLSRKEIIFGAVALPIAIGATAMGLFYRVQILALQEELFDLKSNSQRQFTVAQNRTRLVIAAEKNVQDIRTTLIAMVASNPALADA